MLGVLRDNSNNQVLGYNFKSDINIWSGDETQPSTTLRGHCDAVVKLINWQNKAIVAGDMDGRLLAWNPETGEASRPKCANQKFAIGVAQMCSNSNYVFASSEDQHLNAYTVDENNQL